MVGLNTILAMCYAAMLFGPGRCGARSTRQMTGVNPQASSPLPADYEEEERAQLTAPSPPPAQQTPRAPVHAAVTAAVNGLQGLWGDPITFPLVPVAGALVSDTKLVTWSAYSVRTFGGPHGNTYTATLDLKTLAVSELDVTNTHHDMFCPGVSMLADGKVIVTGGDDAAKTSIYDPATATWRNYTEMNKARGYQATATLSDGRVFVIGGSWNGGTGGKDGEVWTDATGWKPVYGCAVAPMLTADSHAGKRDCHAKLFAWTRGTVFQAGPSHQMNWYDIPGNTTVPAGARGSDPDAMNGNAVMYDAGSGKILMVGGSPDYTDSPATANANIVVIHKYGVNATVHALAPMHFPRSFSNAVVLPDGKVLIIGGQEYAVIFTDTTPVLQPELWDPHTGKFTLMAPMATPRNYHSIAVLLPDGRVFSGGGGLCGGCSANHFDGQIFTPPNLLNPADGSLATRPVISAAPSAVGPGGTMLVTTDSAVAKFNIIRRGTVTHSVDTDQRFIKLGSRHLRTDATGFHYSMLMLRESGIAIPGIWMLFAISPNGVPSVGWTVQITK